MTQHERYACEDVLKVQRLHADLLTPEQRQIPIAELLDRQARRIVASHQSGDTSVTTQIKNWHPTLVARSSEEIMAANFTLDDARLTIAREHGFANWADVEVRGKEQLDTNFESAVDAILSGDADTLRSLLKQNPALIHEQSKYGHRATLLHYVGSNGVETHRQVVPKNLAEITQILLAAGAEVNATAVMYRGGATTLYLLQTGIHPVKAGVITEVAKILKDAGAHTNNR